MPILWEHLQVRSEKGLLAVWNTLQKRSLLDLDGERALSANTRRIDLQLRRDSYDTKLAGELLRSLPNLKTLVFNHYPSFFSPFPLFPDALLEAVVSTKPPGNGIEHIEFRSSFDPPTYSQLIRIATRCHDLKFLHIEYAALLQSDFHLLWSPPTSLSFGQLRVLSLGPANHHGYSLQTIQSYSFVQKGLYRLVSLFDLSPPKLPSIEELHIFGDIPWNSPFVASTGSKLRDLVLSSAWMFDDDGTRDLQSWRQFPNLRRITLVVVPTVHPLPTQLDHVECVNVIESEDFLPDDTLRRATGKVLSMLLRGRHRLLKRVTLDLGGDRRRSDTVWQWVRRFQYLFLDAGIDLELHDNSSD
jgi:hypothetical protein